MSSESQTVSHLHPTDRLPEHARDSLSGEERLAVERHLETCEACREELRLLQALGDAGVPRLTPEERASGYRALERAGAPWSARRAWLLAASLVVLLTGVAVWRANTTESRATSWSAASVIEAWDEDLTELRPRSIDLQIALGADEDSPWLQLEEADVSGVKGPWEDVR